MSTSELKGLMDIGGASVVFAIFAVAIVRLMIKSHREDTHSLMAFMKEERVHREQIMNRATLALQELTHRIDMLGKEQKNV